MKTYLIVLRGGATFEVKDTANLLVEFQQFRSQRDGNNGLPANPILIGQSYIVDLSEVAAVVVK